LRREEIHGVEHVANRPDRRTQHAYERAGGKDADADVQIRGSGECIERFNVRHPPDDRECPDGGRRIGPKFDRIVVNVAARDARKGP
jgi:hypothetical protein